MALALEHRSIPVKRVEIENALEPFEDWSRLDNKTQY
jgi:hypothetical protein